MTRSCRRDAVLKVRTPLSLSRTGGLLVCASLGVAVALPTAVLTERVHRDLRGDPPVDASADVGQARGRAAHARAQAARAALPALRERLLGLQSDDDRDVELDEAEVAPAWLAYLELAAHVSDVRIATLEALQDAPPGVDRSSRDARDVAPSAAGFHVAGSGTFASIRRLTQLIADAAPGLSVVALSIGAEGRCRTLDATLRASRGAPPMAALDGVRRPDGDDGLVAAADPFAGHGPADVIVGIVEMNGRRANVAADGRLIDLEYRTHE